LTKSFSRNIAASVRQRLLNNARETGRPFSELLQYFAMERFLYRLSKSRYTDNFVLKGALMLTVWEAPLSRPTMDIDFLGQIDNNIEAIIAVTKDICGQKVEPDGITFDLTSIRGEPITEDADYAGVRVRFHGSLGTAHFTMQLDIGFGDVVIPAPASLEYPTILDLPAPRIRGYSKESTIAEKFEAMIKLGALNSRMKDFFDIWLLSRQFNFEGQRLAAAIEKTFSIRRADIQSEPIPLTNSFAGDPAKVTQWRGFIRKNRLTNVPQDFGKVIKAIVAFLGPLAKTLAAKKPFEATWIAPGPWRH
jgi:predicted nucleotidyltransferase component of viral defense system